MRDRDDLRDEVVRRLRGDALIDFMSHHMGFNIQRKGREWVMLCPFHDDQKASFTINTTKKPDAPILKCFACGAGGDPLKIIQDYYRLDFKSALTWAGEALGLISGGQVKVEAAPAQRETAPTRTVEIMTPQEVMAAYRELKSNALDPEPWAQKLGIDPRAMTMTGSVVAKVGLKTTLVFPMRDHAGAMTSLRFRDFETRKRWSLDVKKRIGGELVQVKATSSGLMAMPEYFDEDLSLDFQTTVVVEGETDLLAAITMMLRSCGEDTVDWPARWVGLPGVNTCHDMLLQTRLTKVVMTFFDDDKAGRNAAFDHLPMRRVKDEDGSDVLGADGRPQYERDVGGNRAPGLLTKLQERPQGAIQGVAVFPPKKGEGKYDLRRWVQDGCMWREFDAHCRRSGTTDRFGIRLSARARRRVHDDTPAVGTV